MILKMMDTNNGNVMIDNIEQVTMVGISKDCGDTVAIKCVGYEEAVIKKREEILYEILSLYNLSDPPEKMVVCNLVIRSNVDNRKEFRTVLFKGPGFLMNDTGFTVEKYCVEDISKSTIVGL